jgi:chromosome segregation ATPase
MALEGTETHYSLATNGPPSVLDAANIVAGLIPQLQALRKDVEMCDNEYEAARELVVITNDGLHDASDAYDQVESGTTQLEKRTADMKARLDSFQELAQESRDNKPGEDSSRAEKKAWNEGKDDRREIRAEIRKCAHEFNILDGALLVAKEDLAEAETAKLDAQQVAQSAKVSRQVAKDDLRKARAALSVANMEYDKALKLLQSKGLIEMRPSFNLTTYIYALRYPAKQ